MGNLGDAHVSWRARAKFLASFVSARGLQFLAPIVAANLLSRSDYGVIEFAHAAASLAIAVASLGTLGVVPFVILSSLGRATLGAVILHQAGLVVVSLIIYCCAAILVNPLSSPALVALFTAVFALQGFWVYLLRARDAVTRSLFLEALPFTLVAVAASVAWVVAPTHSLFIVAGALLCALVACVWATASQWPRLVPTYSTPLHYVDTLREGIPLMLGGLLALLATTSGRLGIGLVGDAEMTGAFAALSRIAALPIVAHQLAVVARFRDLYAINLPQLELLVMQVGRFVAISVALTLLAVPWASPWLGPAFHLAAQQHPLAAMLLVAQVILWSGISLNDLIAARHEVLPRVLPWSSSALAVVGTVAAWSLTSDVVTVDRFAIWHTTVMFTLFFAQTVALACCGVRFNRFWASCVFAFAGAIALAICLAP